MCLEHSSNGCLLCNKDHTNCCFLSQDCGLGLIVRAAVIQKWETENMGMGKSLSASADKGEQLLLLYAPLGKLLKTHCHGYPPQQTTLFSDIMWQQRDPTEDRLLYSTTRCQWWFLLTSSPSPTVPEPISPSKTWGCPASAPWELLPTALTKPWRWATKNHHSLWLGQGAVREGAWALLCWGKAQRWETVGEGPRRMGGLLRIIEEEASRGNGVYFMIVMSILIIFFFISEQHWLETP